ncbi:unnamed protein product [Owenia fusiformis]|uniref:Major facilitator superfamily (MFS) profile domain-containing protein n=1 Tax=Owenia fusiformis TaxID=6347 RepID=A0A8S4N016_OWEFU|nr:unnamed protein product [Owenia fusiformis]
MAVDYEGYLKNVGHFGWTQLRIWFLVSLAEIPASWAIMIMVFIAAKPNWTCMDNINPDSDSDLTYSAANTSSALILSSSSAQNVSFGKISSCSTAKQCMNLTYESDKSSIVTEWDLICEKNYVGALITTIQMGGMLVGACIVGQLADVWGRKKTFYTVYTLMILLGFCSAFANTWQLFAVIRFFIGACLAGLLVVNFVLPMEFVGPRWRVLFAMQFWCVGIMLLPLPAYFISNWRHLCMATSLPGLLLLATWWLVPESPRWLAMQGRVEEAGHVLQWLADSNNVKTFTVDYDILKQVAKVERDKVSTVRAYSYWDLCRTPTLAKVTAILGYAWFVNSAVYYGLSLNVKHLSGNKYLNIFISGVVEIPALLAVYFIDAFGGGRRISMFSFMMFSGVASLCIQFINMAGKYEELEDVVTVLAMLGKFGVSGSWSLAYIYAAEAYPTNARNLGIGANSMMGRVGGMLAPQLVFLDSITKSLPFVIFGVLGISSALLLLLLPETARKPLPDAMPSWSWCKTQTPGTVERNELDQLNSDCGVQTHKLQIDNQDDINPEQVLVNGNAIL